MEWSHFQLAQSVGVFDYGLGLGLEAYGLAFVLRFVVLVLEQAWSSSKHDLVCNAELS